MLNSWLAALRAAMPMALMIMGWLLVNNPVQAGQQWNRNDVATGATSTVFEPVIPANPTTTISGTLIVGRNDANNADAAGSVTVNAGQTFITNGRLQITALGTFTLNNGATFTNNGTLQNAGNVIVTDGITWNITATNFLNTGIITLNGNGNTLNFNASNGSVGQYLFTGDNNTVNIGTGITTAAHLNFHSSTGTAHTSTLNFLGNSGTLGTAAGGSGLGIGAERNVATEVNLIGTGNIHHLYMSNSGAASGVAVLNVGSAGGTADLSILSSATIGVNGRAGVGTININSTSSLTNRGNLVNHATINNQGVFTNNGQFSGRMTLDGGTFNALAGATAFTNLTITSNGGTVNGTTAITHNGATSLQGDLTTSGTVGLGAISLGTNGRTLTVNSGSVTATSIAIGSYMFTVDGTGNANLGTVNLNGGTLVRGTGGTLGFTTLNVGINGATLFGTSDISGAATVLEGNLFTNDEVSLGAISFGENYTRGTLTTNSSTVNATSLNIGTQIFEVAGTASLGAITISGGSLTHSTSGTLAFTTLTASTGTNTLDLKGGAVSGGTLSVSGELSISGTADFTATNTSITGKLALDNSGTIILGATTLGGELVATNSGTISALTVSNRNAVISGTESVSITNTSLRNDSILTLTGVTNNLGNVNVAGTAEIVTSGTANLGTLSFSATSNRLTLTNGTFSTATSTAGTNGIIDLHNSSLDLIGDLHLNELHVSGTNGSQLAATNSGTLAIATKTVLGGNLTANSKITDFKSTVVAGTSSINANGNLALGTVTFSGDNRALTLTNGTYTAGTINISNRNVLTIDSGVGLNVTGDLILAGGTLDNRGGGTFSGALTVNAGNSFLSGNVIGFNGTTNIAGNLTISGAGTTWELNDLNVGSSVRENYRLINNLDDDNAAINFGTLIIGDRFTLVGGDFSSSNGVDLRGGKTLTLSDDVNAFGARLKLSSGYLAIADGVLVLNLSTPQSSIKGETAMITAPAVTIGTNGKINIRGGSKGNIYEIIHTTVNTANEVAIEAAIRRNSGILFKYELVNGLGGLYTVGVGYGSTEEIITAANTDTTSNTGIATAISTIMNVQSAQVEMRSILDQLQGMSGDAHEFSRAVSELNGTDLKTATAGMSVDSAHQFNAALGQVFADATTSNFALAALRETADRTASAGGKPMFGATGTPTAQKWGGFFKTYGGWGQQDSKPAACGFDFGGLGMMAGVSYNVAEELRFGGLLGYTANETRLAQNFGSATDGVLRLGGFGQFQWDNLFFNSAPTFGIHLMETKRNLNSFAMTAESQRTGFDFNLFNQFGYIFDLRGIMFTPSFSLGMIYLHDPAHVENGAGQANLAVRSYDSWSLTQNLELKFGKAFCWRGLRILPEIWGGWEYEYLRENNIGMAFAAVPEYGWLSPVSRIPANRAVFGMGITTLLSDRTEFFGRYDQKIWSGGFSTNFMLGLNVKF